MFPNITDDPKFFIAYPLMLERIKQKNIDHAIAILQQEEVVSPVTYYNLIVNFPLKTLLSCNSTEGIHQCVREILASNIDTPISSTLEKLPGLTEFDAVLLELAEEPILEIPSFDSDALIELSLLHLTREQYLQSSLDQACMYLGHSYELFQDKHGEEEMSAMIESIQRKAQRKEPLNDNEAEIFNCARNRRRAVLQTMLLSQERILTQTYDPSQSRYANFVATCVLVYLNYKFINPHPLHQQQISHQLLVQCREIIDVCPFNEESSNGKEFPKIVAHLLFTYLKLIDEHSREDSPRLLIFWEKLNAHPCFESFKNEMLFPIIKEKISENIEIIKPQPWPSLANTESFPKVKNLSESEKKAYIWIKKGCDQANMDLVLRIFGQNLELLDKLPGQNLGLLDKLPLDYIFNSLAYQLDVNEISKINKHEKIRAKISDDLYSGLIITNLNGINAQLEILTKELEFAGQEKNYSRCYDQVLSLIRKIKLIEYEQFRYTDLLDCTQFRLLPSSTGILMIKSYTILAELLHKKSLLKFERNIENESLILQTGFLYFKNHFPKECDEKSNYVSLDLATEYLRSYLFYLKETPLAFQTHCENIEYLLTKFLHASWLIPTNPILFNSICMYLNQLSTQNLSIKRAKIALTILQEFNRKSLNALVKDCLEEEDYAQFNSYIFGMGRIITNQLNAARLAYKYIKANHQEKEEFGFTFPYIQQLLSLVNNYVEIFHLLKAQLISPRDELFKNDLIIYLNGWTGDQGEIVTFKRDVDGLYNEIFQNRQIIADQLIAEETAIAIKAAEITLNKQKAFLHSVKKPKPVLSSATEEDLTDEFDYASHCSSFLERYRHQLTLEMGNQELNQLNAVKPQTAQNQIFINVAKLYIGISILKHSFEFHKFHKQITKIMEHITHAPICTEDNLSEQLIIKGLLFDIYLPSSTKAKDVTNSLYEKINTQLDLLKETIALLYHLLDNTELNLAHQQFIHYYLNQSHHEVTDFSEKITQVDTASVQWYKNRYRDYILPIKQQSNDSYKPKDIRNLQLSRIMEEFAAELVIEEEEQLEQFFDDFTTAIEPVKSLSFEEELISLLQKLPATEHKFIFGSAATEFVTQGLLKARDIDLILLSSNVLLLKQQLQLMGAKPTFINNLLTFPIGQIGKYKIDVVVLELDPMKPFSIASFLAEESKKSRLSLSNIFLEYCPEGKFNIYDLNDGQNDIQKRLLRIENLDQLEPDYFPCILDKFLRVGFNGKAQIMRTLKDKIISWDGSFANVDIKKHFCILILKYLTQYYCEEDKTKLQKYCELLTGAFFGQLIYKVCPTLGKFKIENIDTWVLEAQEALQKAQYSCKDERATDPVEQDEPKSSDEILNLPSLLSTFSIFIPSSSGVVDMNEDDGFVYDL